MAAMSDSITCPRCGRTSYNANDITQGYCGHCHWWTSDLILGRWDPDDIVPRDPRLLPE